MPFSEIIWDHPNVSGWAVTSTLAGVEIEGNMLRIPHTRACTWPAPDGVVNANSWVIHRNPVDGRWHANTWDFMRVCQEEKLKTSVGSPDNWRPVAGEVVYLFISGIIRPGYDDMRNVQERTNIVRLVWE